MVSKAYLQGLLEQIAVQTGALDTNQTKYSESGSSLVEHRGNVLVHRGVSYEYSDHSVIVQHDFLGQGNQTDAILRLLLVKQVMLFLEDAPWWIRSFS